MEPDRWEEEKQMSDIDFTEEFRLLTITARMMVLGSLDNDKDTPRCCETCRYDLGGGYENSKINLEIECGSGNYEAWAPKEGA